MTMKKIIFFMKLLFSIIVELEEFAIRTEISTLIIFNIEFNNNTNNAIYDRREMLNKCIHL